MSGDNIQSVLTIGHNDVPQFLRCYAEDLRQAVTVERVSNALVRHSLPIFNASVVVLALLSEDRSEFYCPLIEGYPHGIANSWRRFSADAHMPIPLAVRQDRLVLLETLEQRHSFYPVNLQLPAHVGRALATIPFRHDHVTGAVGFTFPSDRTFVESDCEQFKAVVSLCAVALARVLRYGIGFEVLVVEDEPAVLKMLEYALKYHAFTVRTALGGEEAIGIYQQHKDTIGVVLLDVQMPVMDGPETLLALRNIDPTLHCIFMSGNTGNYTREQLLGFGASLVLSKPFSRLEKLMQELRLIARRQTVLPA